MVTIYAYDFQKAENVLEPLMFLVEKNVTSQLALT